MLDRFGVDERLTLLGLCAAQARRPCGCALAACEVGLDEVVEGASLTLRHREAHVGYTDHVHLYTFGEIVPRARPQSGVELFELRHELPDVAYHVGPRQVECLVLTCEVHAVEQWVDEDVHDIWDQEPFGLAVDVEDAVALHVLPRAGGCQHRDSVCVHATFPDFREESRDHLEDLLEEFGMLLHHLGPRDAPVVWDGAAQVVRVDVEHAGPDLDPELVGRLLACEPGVGREASLAADDSVLAPAHDAVRVEVPILLTLGVIDLLHEDVELRHGEVVRVEVADMRRLDDRDTRTHLREQLAQRDVIADGDGERHEAVSFCALSPRY